MFKKIHYLDTNKPVYVIAHVSKKRLGLGVLFVLYITILIIYLILLLHIYNVYNYNFLFIAKIFTLVYLLYHFI